MREARAHVRQEKVGLDEPKVRQPLGEGLAVLVFGENRGEPFLGPPRAVRVYLNPPHRLGKVPLRVAPLVRGEEPTTPTRKSPWPKEGSRRRNRQRGLSAV